MYVGPVPCSSLAYLILLLLMPHSVLMYQKVSVYHSLITNNGDR